jgi:sugar-specific transcriptional regulator TrmB
MKDQLKDLGFTENEAIIYETLLRLGPSPAGEIAKKSGLHRRVTYDTLAMLSEKGLISYIAQNNTRLFQATDPKTILELLKEKQARIEEILPEMETLFSSTKEKEETNFFKGRGGLKTVMEDQLSTRKEILILGGNPDAYDILQFYFRWFDKRRVKQKIKVKIIFNKTEKKLNIPLSDIRFLPQKYSSPLAVNIYGDKVALILWSKENPFAVVIKNPEISQGYRKYFELMWKSALKTN